MQRYFGEAEEISSYPSSFPLISFCYGGSLCSGVTKLASSLCSVQPPEGSAQPLTPALWGRKMGNQFAQVKCVELRLC